MSMKPSDELFIVHRWTIGVDSRVDRGWDASPDYEGEWVRYSDYEQLRKELFQYKLALRMASDHISPPQPEPCGCTTFCRQEIRPDARDSAPLRRGYFCKKASAEAKHG